MASLRADRRGVLEPCPSCKTVNRRPYGTLSRTTRCGRCKTSLPTPGGPVDVPDAQSFDAMLAGTTLPVAVDFWAPWCGPCRVMAPELEQAAQALAGQVLVAKVDTEAVPALADRYRIRSIPTLAVFVRGGEVARTSGAMPAARIRAFVADASPG